MVVAGLAMAVVGFVFVFNVGGAADAFASTARPLPAWMTWPWGASPAYYRFFGAALVAISAFFLGAGLNT